MGVDPGAVSAAFAIIPWDLDGGLDAATNLRLACRRCNSARQNRTLAQWAIHARQTIGLEINVWDVIAGAYRPLAA